MKKEDKTSSQSNWIRQKFEKIGNKLDIHKNGVIYLKEIDDLLQQVEAKLRTPLSQFFNAYAIQSKRQTISHSLLVSNLVKAWTLNKFDLKEIITENKKVNEIKEECLTQNNPPLKVPLEDQPDNPKEKDRKLRELARNITPVNPEMKSTQLRHEEHSSISEEVAINCVIYPTAVKIKEQSTNQFKYHSNTGSKIYSKKRSIVKPEKYLSKYLTKKDTDTLKKKCLHKKSSIKVEAHSEEISLTSKGRSQNGSVKREYGFAETQLSCGSPALIFASSQEKLKIPSSSETPRNKKLCKLSQFCRPRTETGHKQRNSKQNLLSNRKEITDMNPLGSLPEHHSRESSFFDVGLEAMSSLPNNLGNSKESETSFSSEFDEIKDWILNYSRAGSTEIKTFSGKNNKYFFDVQSPCKLTQLLRHGYAYKDREKKLYHEHKIQKIQGEDKTVNRPENVKGMQRARRPNEFLLKSHQTEFKCFPKIGRSNNLPETRDFMNQIFRLTEEEISRPNRGGEKAIRLERANPKFYEMKRSSNSALDMTKNLGQIFGKYSKDELQQLQKLHLLYAAQKEEKIQRLQKNLIQNRKGLYNEVFTSFI